MPNWKKVIVSGSNAILNQITASGIINDSTVVGTKLTGSFTGSFVGDGNNLDLSSNTSISTTPFPFAGDGIISGSLLISSSNVGGVSTASLSLQGSGSTIFTIQGSQGNLFSVTDDLLHDNLVVNDISGDTLFKVSGSGLVTIPVGDLSGSGAATASYGHFIGDGSQLTNLPEGTTPTLAQVVTAGASAAGDVQLTGSLNVSGSIGLTDGRNNVLLGEEAGKNLTTGTNSVMVGYGAGADSTLDTESNFVFIGYQAGSGSIAGYGASGGSVYIGSQAGAGSDTNPGIGFGNTAIGYQTGYKANIQYSTGIGYGVFSNVDGNGNEDVAIGYNAMNRVAGGSTQNVAIGNSSLKGYNTSYISNRNTAVGYFTGKELVNSHDNVLLGWKAGEDLSTSAGPSNYGGNIFIGTLAGDNIGTGYNNIHLGPGLSGNSADIGQVKIGSGSAILISGSITTGDVIFYNTASAPNFSGSFQGDGSQLTNLNTTTPTLQQVVTAGATAAGDVQITGSLIISQSYTAGDTDSTALRLFGSGSVSESGIFEVEGSAGPLFSVADGLDGVLMEVNNISGLPLFQVSSSNEVFINRGNLTSGVTTATASFAHFTGSFQGDGSQLTNLPAGSTPTLAQVVTAGASATGDAQITGSLTISGSFEPRGKLGNLTSVAIGYQAANTTTGERNIAIGYEALKMNYGSDNVVIGSYALDRHYASDDSSENVVIGSYAADISTSDANVDQNVVIGYQAMSNGRSRTVGNIVIGYQAIAGTAYGGDKNIVIGYQAGHTLSNIGTAGNSRSHPGHNVIIGPSASVAYSGSVDTLVIASGSSYLISGSFVTGDILFFNTASAPNFSGSFQGDGSQLTNLPAASAGSTAGRVVFTTTSGELTTESGFDYNSSTNQLTVESLNVTHFTSSFITSSQVLSSGSNILGDDVSDTQTLIGTTKMTGSAEIDGNTQITGSLTISGSSTPFNIPGFLSIAPNLQIGEGGSNQNSSNTVLGPGTTDGGGGYRSVIIGHDVSNGANYRNVVIGESLTLAYPVNESVVIGDRANSGESNSVSIGSQAGTTSTKGINIGHFAQGSGKRNIVFNTSTSQVTPSTANAFGVYMTSNSLPDFEVVGVSGSNGQFGGTSTLRTNLIVSSSIPTAATSSLSVHGSGSTVFEVIGSEGTLFSIDDDLDGVVFTANDRSGLPVLEASASGEVYIGKAPQSLYTTAVISSTTAATTQSIFGLSTSSYGGAFFDYTVQSGSDARAGSIMSVWNSSNISFTETTTTDIGDTTDFNVIVHISQSQAQIASHASRAGYNIKTIIRSI